MATEDKPTGWHWFAFLFGPFWYLVNGMTSKALWLLLVCTLTFGLAAPFVWIFCGAKGRRDHWEYRLRSKNRYDIDRL